MQVAKGIDIAATPERVYAYLLEFARHSEWTTPAHAVHITADSIGPVVVGSTFTSEAHQFGSRRDALKVTELVPDRRIVYEVTMKDGNSLRNTFEIAPAENGAHVTKAVESLKENLVGKLMSPIFRMAAPKALNDDLGRIKSRMEQSPPS